MRKAKTGSGATAVQIVHKTGSRRNGIEHIPILKTKTTKTGTKIHMKLP